ncbi:uncharacterized protein METZ01_LOCUS401743 [marine metagenome]|uniref:Uncharacterized protein n=1 Tax=marine metagenome TaxID=408172 RepID=A0A382VQQ9_9ZZZZ
MVLSYWPVSDRKGVSLYACGLKLVMTISINLGLDVL